MEKSGDDIWLMQEYILVTFWRGKSIQAQNIHELKNITSVVISTLFLPRGRKDKDRKHMEKETYNLKVCIREI